MTHQQIREFEQSISGLTLQDKQELLDRLQRSIQREASAAPQPSKDDFHRRLIKMGRMTRLPDSAVDFDDPDDRPIDIQGEPLSETVIRDRR